jgi:hypothetical protein
MEKTFQQEVPHTLGKVEAKRRMDDGLPKLLSMLPGGRADHPWDGDAMLMDYAALGQSASARMEVLEDRVLVTIALGGMLAAMGEKIAGMLGRGTREMLDDKRTPR